MSLFGVSWRRVTSNEILKLNYYQAEIGTLFSRQSSPFPPTPSTYLSRFRWLSFGVWRCSFSLLTSPGDGSEMERCVQAGAGGEWRRGELRSGVEWRGEKRRGAARRGGRSSPRAHSRAAEQPSTSVSTASNFTLMWVRDVFKCSSPAPITQVQSHPCDGTARGEGERNATVITYIWLRTQEIKRGGV